MGPDTARNAARHTDTLNDQTILDAANRLVKPDGEIAILLPMPEYKLFEHLFNDNGWYCGHSLMVRNLPESKPNRIIAIFSRVQKLKVEEHLVIRKEANQYTPEFETLMKPFYLNL